MCRRCGAVLRSAVLTLCFACAMIGGLSDTGPRTYDPGPRDLPTSSVATATSSAALNAYQIITPPFRRRIP
jgi:hypothetical protein